MNNLLPRFCVFIGWALCISIIFVSIFFLWSYGVMFGNDKTYQWLSSLLVSFFGGILIVEPLKVSVVVVVVVGSIPAPTYLQRRDRVQWLCQETY